MSVKCEIYKKVPCNLTLGELEEKLKLKEKQGALQELDLIYSRIINLKNIKEDSLAEALVYEKIQNILEKRIKELERGVSE